MGMGLGLGLGDVGVVAQGRNESGLREVWGQVSMCLLMHE